MHCLPRNTVERCIGVLKARWRCLLLQRVLYYDHHMAKIINPCAVLHNFCNRNRLPAPEVPAEEVEEDGLPPEDKVCFLVRREHCGWSKGTNYVPPLCSS
nr:unnamed protein product [Callosobruchus analis]